MFLRIDQKLSDDLISKEHLGGKGYGLYVMSHQGVNVPPALILPTTVCVDYQKKPKTVMKEIGKQVAMIQEYFTEKFGYMPLLSVRSGARVSMPGMMDTILNVGITTDTWSLWSKKLGNDCFLNCKHRLSEMYGNTVLGMSPREITNALEGEGVPVPDNFKDQVLACIEAVFKSWDNDRAIFYRKLNKIPNEWGTAVVVQAMVFGNLNDQSGTGVLFTRNPDSGENKISGEFLINAQGEDVVAGVRTPMPLSQMKDWNAQVSEDLAAAVNKLEMENKDVQDVEFTIQDGELFILQTRSAKRSAPAAVRIAVDMMNEGLITATTACKRVSLRDMDLMCMPVLDPKYDIEPKATGIPACSGVVTGKPVFSSKEAIECTVPCILVTEETTPDDIEGMHAAAAVLTMTGGSTSHAAVVARGMNKPCVVGVGLKSLVFQAELISIDGATGRVWLHPVPVVDNSADPYIQKFKEMVRKTMKYVPVIDGIPAEKLDEALITIDTLMEMPLDAAKMYLKSLTDVVVQLYIDIRAPHVIQQAFHSIFMDLTQREQKAADYVKFLQDDFTTKGWVSLVTSKNVNTDYPIIPTTGDLESLILAKGLMGMVSGSGPAFDKVMKWKKEEGVEMVSFGEFKAGVLSVLSDAQVHRLLVG